jgi:hypothetical protein
MPNYETTKRTTKVFSAKHSEPGSFRKGYILLPVGYKYNSEWRTAKNGDKLKLWDGGLYTIYAVRRLSLDKPEADILCRLRYGIPLKRCISIWKSNALIEGHGANAISTDECLWIIYDTE